MTEQPTDWIKDAGWLSGLYETARRGNRSEFDAMLRRLLYEHGRTNADAEVRRVVERVICCLCHSRTATGYVIEKYGNGTFLSCDHTECTSRGEYHELTDLGPLAETEEGSP